MKIDQLSNDLSELMLSASGVLRQCEAKLVEFKGCGDLRVGGEIHRLASELDAMFTGVGAQYRLAQEKARVARSLLDSLMDGVRRGGDRDVDEEGKLRNPPWVPVRSGHQPCKQLSSAA